MSLIAAKARFSVSAAGSCAFALSYPRQQKLPNDGEHNGAEKSPVMP
jgi:hypothetical protein